MISEMPKASKIQNCNSLNKGGLDVANQTMLVITKAKNKPPLDDVSSISINYELEREEVDLTFDRSLSGQVSDDDQFMKLASEQKDLEMGKY